MLCGGATYRFDLPLLKVFWAGVVLVDVGTTNFGLLGIANGAFQALPGKQNSREMQRALSAGNPFDSQLRDRI